MNLRIPGPTPLPPEVLKAQSRQMISHRDQEFAELFARLRQDLGHVFQTRNDILVLVASGTGGLEAGIVNFLSAGERVLAVTIGSFGERFRDIARSHGAEVIELASEWGQATDAESLRKALSADPEIKAVLITHNETSTGVTQDLGLLSQVVRKVRPEALVIVDAISSLSSLPLPADDWDIDVVIACSQKGLMTPPGLAMVSVSRRAWEAYARARMPRFYMDLGKLKKQIETDGTHPFTPALSLFYALEVALGLIKEEGLEAVFQRHRQIGEFVRGRLEALDLKLFADPRYASNSVTAISVPEGVEAGKVLKVLREKYGVVLSGAPGKLRGKVWRIGHMGYVSQAEVAEALDALGKVLKDIPPSR